MKAVITGTNQKFVLTVDGKKYPVRYFTQPEGGEVVAVLNTEELQGKYGDEFPLALVENYKNGSFVRV